MRLTFDPDKLVKQVIKNRTTNHLEDHNLIVSSRANENGLLGMSKNSLNVKVMEKGGPTGLIFLGFQKIKHKMLLKSSLSHNEIPSSIEDKKLYGRKEAKNRIKW